MANSRNKPVGTIRIAPNGYHYIKVQNPDATTCWRFKHHVAMEKYIGRPLREDERVSFVTGKKDNFNEKNLRLSIKGTKSNAKRIAQIESKIEELQAELEELRS